MKSLSKIYRLGEEDNVQKIQFRDLEDLQESENGMFIPSGEDSSREGKSRDSAQGKKSSRKNKEPEGGISSQEAESMRSQAYSEGWQEGYVQGKQAGREEADKELQEATQALAEALEKVNSLRSSLLRQNKQDMVRLVLTISEQVIQAEVRTREDIIQQAVEKAIQSAVQSEECRIKVNPRDMEVVQEKKPLFLASVSGLKDIVFEAEESVTPGGCIVESEQGMVDATIETQLEKIREQLFQLIKGGEEQWSN